MSLLNQLRITDPEDQLKIYDLDEAGSTTSLGQDESNDILLESPGVAPFQLELHYRQEPYRLTVPGEAEPVTVNGEAVSPGSSCQIHDRDEIRVAGYVLVFRVRKEEPDVPDHVPEPLPQPEPGPPSPEEPAPDASDTPDAEPAGPAILTAITPDEWAVDVEQTATFQLSVVNAGELVADFHVAAEGVPQEWVTISPAKFHLNEGEEEPVEVSVTPPRSPSSRAGTHQLVLVVTSPIYPGERSQASAAISIDPYYDLDVGDRPSPRRLSIPGSEPWGQVKVELTNRGNSDVVVLLEGEDDACACRFDFVIADGVREAVEETEGAGLRVPADQTVSVPVRLTPQDRPLIGPGGRLFDLRPCTRPYTVTVTMTEDGQRPWSLCGEWENAPQLSRAVLVVAAIALVLLLAAVVYAVISGG